MNNGTTKVHEDMEIARQPFSCQRGSLTIRGYVFRKKPGSLPAIIICHGFMTSQRMVRHYAEFLAGLGWAAFTFDFCGGGIRSISDGKQEEMTVLTEVEDLKAVIDHVNQRNDVDPKNISLMGCSQGGLVCALTAARLRDGIKNLILFYPAFCIPDHARRGRMLFARFDPENIPEIISHFPMKLGGDYAKAVINMNIYDEIRGYEGPVLLVHGTCDRIVNVSYARHAREVYRKCRYLEIEGAGHMFTREYDRKAMKAIEDFLYGTTLP